MEKIDHSGRLTTITLNIGGMHCESCVGRVQTALLRLNGVAEAAVELASQRAKIIFNSEKVNADDLKASVEAEGYHIVDESNTDTGFKEECCSLPFSWFSNPRSYLYGALAAIAVVGVYLGMNTLTADWYFARIQFSDYRWWILTLAIGLGVQVALFTLFRAHFRSRKIKAVKSTMAASGGMSATAMMACCSHYLATVIPALGVPFLSAAAVSRIAEYQTYFFVAAVLSCLVGIGMMLRMMEKHGLIQFGKIKALLSLRLNRVSG